MTAPERLHAMATLPNADRVIDVVAAYFNLEAGRLREARRSMSITHPRFMAMWILHRGLGMTLVAVGEIFERDHTTVLHGCRQVDVWRKDNATIKAQIREMLKKLGITVVEEKEEAVV